MAVNPFNPLKLLGMGCFSLVYSVTPNNDQERDKVFALKRFFIRHPKALLYAIKEFNILKRLALSDSVSPFLPKLLYAFRIHASPALVLRNFDEKAIKFYLREIICGLRYLHALDIVQLDLKPDNILLSETNHIIISDFDRSFDFTAKKNIPTGPDFLSTVYYMAPEIARCQVISDKADVWSLGIIASLFIGDTFRPFTDNVRASFRMASKGQWKLNCYGKISPEFKEFLHACFTYSYVQRPNVSQLQNLAFFRDTDWNRVQSLQLHPPYSTHEIKNIVTNLRFNFDPYSPMILELLYDRGYPKIKNGNFQFRYKQDGTQEIIKSSATVECFSKIGYTPEMVVDAYRQFNFTNPCLLQQQQQRATELPKLRSLKLVFKNYFNSNQLLHKRLKFNFILFARAESIQINWGKQNIRSGRNFNKKRQMSRLNAKLLAQIDELGRLLPSNVIEINAYRFDSSESDSRPPLEAAETIIPFFLHRMIQGSILSVDTFTRQINRIWSGISYQTSSSFSFSDFLFLWAIADFKAIANNKLEMSSIRTCAIAPNVFFSLLKIKSYPFDSDCFRHCLQTEFANTRFQNLNLIKSDGTQEKFRFGYFLLDPSGCLVPFLDGDESIRSSLPAGVWCTEGTENGQKSIAVGDTSPISTGVGQIELVLTATLQTSGSAGVLVPTEEVLFSVCSSLNCFVGV
nr:hypothetical transcript [Hymenolepis microstoma]